MKRKHQRRARLFSLAIVLLLCTTARSQEQLRVGYIVAAAAPGSRLPASAALFSYINNGILVSEAAAPATAPLRAFSVFVDERDTQTGIAVVNSSTRRANLSMRLRNAAGVEVMRRD